MSLDYGVDAAFADLVAARLESIESRLRESAFARTPFVTDAAAHIINAGGKRFRPLLVVLASELYPGADPDAVDRAAMVVELTHVASLYHDDVMDEAELRRGAVSANWIANPSCRRRHRRLARIRRRRSSLRDRRRRSSASRARRRRRPR